MDGRVIVGVDEDGQPASAGYIVAASLDTGDPVWEFQTDVGTPGSTRVLDDSCGSVWSSGTVLPDLGLVVFGTADCKFGGSALYADSVIALRIANGRLAWKFHPLGHAPACDDDFGASANAGLSAAGRTTFLGEGSKNGTYYSLNPRTGRLRWSTNVVFGGSSGGFIGTTAYDGRRVLGATGLGDFLPTSRGTLPVCDPSDPRDVEQQNPTDHAFDAAYRGGALAGQRLGVVLGHHGGRRDDVQRPCAGRQGDPGARRLQRAPARRRSACPSSTGPASPPWATPWSSASAPPRRRRSSGIEVLTPGGTPPLVPGSG